MKTWLTQGAWMAYANCGDDPRHITPPENMSEQDREETQYICHKCPVRGECISAAVKNNSTGIWCASEWVPEVSLDMSKREALDTLDKAKAIREGLADTIDDEIQRRGEF